MNYKNKKVILVGGSGFIGTQLAHALHTQGAEVVIIDPAPSKLSFVQYIKSDLHTIADFEILQNPFAVFNLAGVPIFARWNKEYKEKIRTSRIDTTRTLVQKFQNPLYRPTHFVTTSAIGVYGDRGEEILNENSSCIQNTYLAQVAYDWEQEALRAQETGVSVRIVRNGHVLGKGGLLGVMKKLFLYGGGAILGTGRHYLSMVSIERCVQTYLEAPFKEDVVSNAVSLQPVTNKVFSKKIAHVLHRPCWLSVPVWLLRIVYGEFAREITSSQRVYTIHNTSFEDLTAVLEKNLRNK
jgi:uncharacterized protein